MSGLVTGILFYSAYLAGTYKIVEVVGKWPDGLFWVILGFMALVVYLAILVAAVYVMIGD